MLCLLAVTKLVPDVAWPLPIPIGTFACFWKLMFWGFFPRVIMLNITNNLYKTFIQTNMAVRKRKHLKCESHLLHGWMLHHFIQFFCINFKHA